MLIDRTAYGLFVIDRSEAAYGLASGKRLHCQEHVTSLVPSKHGRGGQSAQRFERLIEEAADKFFKKSAERASSYWLPMIENLQGIIIGGPGATKDYVNNKMNNGILINSIDESEIQNAIIEIILNGKKYKNSNEKNLEKFTFNYFGKKLNETYMELLNK